jgi:hypothetical protein
MMDDIDTGYANTGGDQKEAARPQPLGNIPQNGYFIHDDLEGLKRIMRIVCNRSHAVGIPGAI